MEAEQKRLANSLRGTSLNFKTFLPMLVRYRMSPDFPSGYSYRYLHEKKMGRKGLMTHDEVNKANLASYLRNIQTMEQLTRVNTNLRLLRKNEEKILSRGKREIDVELRAIRVGSFVMTTFPGELTVQIGLNIKKQSPHPFTFVAAYTNGYIYYAPTDKQLKNMGNAQEDSDCLVGVGWQAIYEKKAAELLKQLR